MDIGLIAAVAIVAIAAILIYLKVYLKICEPNEILIFSGKKRPLSTGEEVGYRIIRGGWGLKIPIVEKVARLSLATIPIDLEIEGALSNGMIPLDIKAIAHVKIASREGDGLENAVERLLGKPPHEIERIAKTTLEGILRGVLATLTPEEANYQRLEFENRMQEKARQELRNFGFTLDSVKVEDIQDGQGYLEAVGRQRSAIVKRDARIKEAEAEAEATTVEADSRKKAAGAEFTSREAMAGYESSYRTRKARLDEETFRHEVKAEFTRKIEELVHLNEVEEKKVEVNRKKYSAEVVIPAEADRQAAELRAAGSAAVLREQGYAMARAVKEMRHEWEDGDARDLFMIHILPGIVDSVSRVISDNLKVEKLVILGDGGLPKHVGDVAGSVVSFMEQIKSATGLDLTKMMHGGKPPPIKKELEA